MDNLIKFFNSHAGVLGILNSFCMLFVTAIYAGITWWQAKNSKKILIESIKQNRDERLPYIVPTIKEVWGGAFETSTNTRVQLNFEYELENVGDSAAVAIYTLLYARMEYQAEHKLVYAHLMPNYEHSLKIGQKIENNLHFETDEFRDIIEDLEICHTKNIKRIETDATINPFRGPTIILQTLYKNMVGQWFESVLEQELHTIEIPSKEPEEEVEVDGKNYIIRKPGERVINDNIKAGDNYKGWLINPSCSKLSRKMVETDYVRSVLEDCKYMTYSLLEEITI